MADNEFAASLRAKFGNMPSLLLQPSIYKATNHIQEVNEKCYRPSFISIGPLYYGLASLEPIHTQKVYLMIVRGLEGHVRDCYTERFTLRSNEFNEMILVDSAFLVFLFMRGAYICWGLEFTRDLFLLENQVPFFVLEHLFKKAFGAAYPDISFRDLAVGFVENAELSVVRRHHISATTIERIKYATHIAHLQEVGPTMYTIPPTVSSLRAAGVRFVASESTNLLDITFSKGSLYRSMILFEQSHEPIRRISYIVDYMTLFEKLVRTTKDVQILVQCGIIDNWIGSEDEVAKLFNNITKHLVFSNKLYYSDVCQDLHAYANTRWNRWKAILKRDYFAHPWATISVIYAFMLFFLTFLQTIGTFTNN
ncbi:hypothetical protein RND81_10G044800 [Saponaria officinalis]|uniref:Uncharacterized protein n=1 Tax=Saponaria officinalis TaxID=3572 RepID=A0AAW1HYA6_SAPOF